MPFHLRVNANIIQSLNEKMLSNLTGVVKLCNRNLLHFLPRAYLQFITSLCIMLANKMEFMVKKSA